MYCNMLVFVNVKCPHPSLIFSGKAGTYQSILFGWPPSLVQKYWNRMEVTDSVKHSSLLPSW